MKRKRRAPMPKNQKPKIKLKKEKKQPIRRTRRASVYRPEVYQSLYEECGERIIGQRAYSWSKTTGRKVDDFIIEGHQIFMRIVDRFDFNRRDIKFSTYLHGCLNNGFQNFVARTDIPREFPQSDARINTLVSRNGAEQDWDLTDDSTDAAFYMTKVTPDRALMYEELIADLSPLAQ